ncbi:ATP-binding protein [Massilia sp. ST3]|uniref:ATP-binding protein n=1 Tax=Massilia sp. ST3 TaxID=2824903 RepID=UPI001E5BAC85|nr:ATP-binding protein [Massilia sp. ST3]
MSTSMQIPVQDRASTPRHVVRFYHDAATVLAEVAEFLDRGLRGGGAAIVIATPGHLAALRRQLAGFGSPEGRPGWFPGELILLDAAGTLAQFMVGGWPDAGRFEAVVGAAVRRACASGAPVHAFGEMVALLCEQGLYDAAVRLEQLWNELAEACRFSLFCAYPWHLFPTEDQAVNFHRVCCEHDHVCPDGGAAEDGPQDLYHRLAVLEQKNQALRREAARAREAEQTLRHRERELVDFVENAAEGLHRVGPDGIILWANAAELALLGYRWEEYVGRHIAEFHEDPEVIGEILRRLKAGDTLHDLPARLRCKDGSLRNVVISSNACFEDGQLRYSRCFTRDATERQLLEQAHREREALVAELSHANRAKDEFLAMLAHELRNPLAPVSAAAQLLAVAAEDPRRVRQAAAVIARQVGHMKGLIDDLLDVARVTRGLVALSRAPLDLRYVVSEALEQAAPQLDARRHRLEVELPPEPALVSADRKRIVQVVVNLLVNAGKFTPEGGTVRVRMRNLADEIELTVADNGIGIDAELATRVFDLFVQGRRTPDRVQGGLGLGLALARSLVESHGGAITVHSDGAGKGSRFTLHLPRLDQPPSGPGAPAGRAPAAERAGRPLSMLVVDDNRDAADALAGLLQAWGFPACASYTSASALEAAASGCPQVFLLDIGLPEVDGLALARQLRAMPQAAGAVLVAVTGYGQDSDRASTSAAGFDYHLVKPVDAAELLDLLGRIAQQAGA